jgi:hypothetical protein
LCSCSMRSRQLSIALTASGEKEEGMERADIQRF